MFLKIFILLAVVAVLILQALGNTCSGGQHGAPTVANGNCDIACGPDRCLCSDEPSGSSGQFNKCLQRCSRSVPGKNATVTSCPDMKCANVDTCLQYCQTDSCSMECKAKKLCSQECGDGCVKAVCSAKECVQQCFNCTLECTSETEHCRHDCSGGVCYSKCAAKECIRDCGGGPNCTIIEINSSSKHALARSLYLVFVVAYIFI